jgi:tRNA (guanine-N7-)-methyltransferase
MGIEPTLEAWEASVLPLNYTREAVYSTKVILIFQLRSMNKTNYHLRTIRSFAIRIGRMTKAQREALDNLWQQFGLEISKKVDSQSKPSMSGMTSSSLQGSIHGVFACESAFFDFNKIFNRNVPRILEIGFGMGHALIAQAQQKPACDFIGIDVHKPGVGAVLDAIAKHQLKNIRLFCADAVEVLTQCVPDNSLDEVQLFFPDPWPKRKHHKRRLVQTAFVKLIHKKLKPYGKFCLATDWEDYAKHMLKVFSNASDFINAAGDQQFAPRHVDRPLTKFEQRGKNLGHSVWDLVFIKQ